MANNSYPIGQAVIVQTIRLSVIYMVDFSPQKPQVVW